MNLGQRVSFQISGKMAYGYVVSDELAGRRQVAVDPQYMLGAQGELSIVIWIAVVALTVVA